MTLPSVGIIGAGSRGLRLSKICEKHGSLGGIAEILPDRLRRACAEFPNVVSTDDVKQIFTSNVDAVAIATSAHIQFGIALEALAYRKHVFVDKPLAVTEEGALAVAAKAARVGRSIFVGHELLFHPAIVAQRALVKSGTIGNIIHIRARGFQQSSTFNDQDVWSQLAPDRVAFIVALLGEPISVAASHQARSHGGLADFVYADMQFRGGRSAHIEVTWLEPGVSSRFDIFGTRGVASVETAITEPQLSLHLPRRGQLIRNAAAVEFDAPVIVRFPQADALENALLAFLLSFSDKVKPLSNSTQSVSTARTLAAVTRACAYQTAEFVAPGTRQYAFESKLTRSPSSIDDNFA